MAYSEVNALRKEGRLEEAYMIAVSDVQAEDNEWSRRGLFWVLRDKFNRNLAEGNREECQSLYQQMQAVAKYKINTDSYVERALNKAQAMLMPHYGLIAQAEKLSRSGHEEEAYEMVERVHAATPVEDQLHESFGWIIYRYLRKCYAMAGSRPARETLLVYMRLHNGRPSMLHSQMLNLASKISEQYSDFRLLSFIRMWDVRNFRDEDLHETESNGKTFTPLYMRIFRRCMALGCPLEDCLDTFCANPAVGREALVAEYSKYYYNIVYKQKNNREEELRTIQQYLQKGAGQLSANIYHSKILRSYLFLNKDHVLPSAKETLEAFGFDKFHYTDWRRGHADDGREYPSLVERFIKTYKDSLSQSGSRCPSRSIEPLLVEAVGRYSDNDQMLRFLALAYAAWGEKAKAVEMYRHLLLADSKYYFWKELSQLVDDYELKVSALCMALLSEKREEYLGEVHLLLAGAMITGQLFSEARHELDVYAGTYQQKGWGMKADYQKLMKILPAGTVPAQDNRAFYLQHREKAEDFVYSRLPWTFMVATEIVPAKDDPRKVAAKLVGTDGSVVFAKPRLIGSKIKKNIVGECFEAKLLEKGGRKHAVLLRRSGKKLTDIFEPCIGYVDYYNEEKLLAHVFDAQSRPYLVPLSGQESKAKFIRFCPLPCEEGKTDCIPQGIFVAETDSATGSEAFPEHVGIVDNVNELKQLFHCVFGHDDDCVVNFSSTPLRPRTGDVVVARYIHRRDKNGRLRKSVFDIRVDNSRSTPLLTEVEGNVRVTRTAAGGVFGFVEDYYVPEHLLRNVADGETVKVKALFDGSRWHVFSLEKAGNQ